MTNMDIWNAIKDVPAEYLSKVPGGANLSSIDPMWRAMRLTEEFGPCGLGWGYTVADVQWHGEIVYVRVDFWWRPMGKDPCHIEAWGGHEVKGRQPDEALKMATTDAWGKAASLLGLGASVYLGEHDGDKYQRPAQPASQPRQRPPASGGGGLSAPRQQAPSGAPSAPLESWIEKLAFDEDGQAIPPTPRVAALGSVDPDNPACPSCGGQMWDNREHARGGKGKFEKKNAKAPDFRCRDKECDGAFWPHEWQSECARFWLAERQGTLPGGNPHAHAPPVGEPPPTDDPIPF